jgi:hypothetical protein
MKSIGLVQVAEDGRGVSPRSSVQGRIRTYPSTRIRSNDGVSAELFDRAYSTVRTMVLTLFSGARVTVLTDPRGIAFIETERQGNNPAMFRS